MICEVGGGVSAHKNFPLRYLAGSLTFRVSFFRKISLIGTSPSEQDKNVNNIGSFQNLLETNAEMSFRRILCDLSKSQISTSAQWLRDGDFKTIGRSHIFSFSHELA